MVVDVRTKEIPARTITEKWYVAFDGREFLSESACKDWESWLETKKRPVFQTCITNVRTLDDESAVLYNIRSGEDYQDLMSTFSDRQKKNFSDDYMKHGPGWYIYFSIDGGDGPDFHYLYNYDGYVKEQEEELSKWKQDMDCKMQSLTIE